MVLLLALALGMVTLWWALEGGGGHRTAEYGLAPSPPEDAPATRTAAPFVSTRTEHGGGDPSGIDPAGAEPRVGGRRGRPDPRRFEGPPGTIRGHLQVSDDTPFPTRWTLVIEPSATLVGREHAARREVEIPDGRPDFEVTGLPLAGYDVRARAAGMNGYAVPVLLERRSPHSFVNLSLARAGFLEGVVLDANSAAVAEFPLTLESLGDGRTWTATTDVVGNFRFEDVLDGGYKLHYGNPFSPIAPPRTLQVRAPGMTLPPATVPVLASVWILVLDAAGNTVEGATLRGTGEAGGFLEGKTDEGGLLLVRHLPPGRFRLRAEHPEHGSVREVIELEAGERKEVTVSFR